MCVNKKLFNMLLLEPAAFANFCICRIWHIWQICVDVFLLGVCSGLRVNDIGITVLMNIFELSGQSLIS